MAREIKQEFNYSRLEDMVKEEIFRLRDPDLWRKAFYNEDGKGSSIALVKTFR